MQDTDQQKGKQETETPGQSLEINVKGIIGLIAYRRKLYFSRTSLQCSQIWIRLSTSKTLNCSKAGYLAGYLAIPSSICL